MVRPDRRLAELDALETDGPRRQASRRSAMPGLSPSFAEREQRDLLAGDLELVQLARYRHPAVRWWWGVRLVEGVNGAWCYLCERHIATWARRWPMTDQARLSILEHRDGEHWRGGTP